MAGSTRGLGRGLEALFNSSTSQEQGTEAPGLQNLPIDQIEPNPDQPRKAVSESALHELAQSIQNQGLLQPLLIRPHPSKDERYQIIAGERRWRASRLAKLSTVPVLIQDITDSEALVIGLVENLQRQDLNPVEESRALDRLLEELQVSQDELAKRIGRSRSAIANSLRLLHLEEDILEVLAAGDISSGQARTLLALTESRARIQLFQAALDKHLTVRQMEQAVTYWKTHGQLPPSLQNATQQQEPDPARTGFEGLRTQLQQALTQHFQAGVRIKGRKDKGRITLAYTSESELRHLIHKLGIDPDSCFT